MDNKWGQNTRESRDLKWEFIMVEIQYKNLSAQGIKGILLLLKKTNIGRKECVVRAGVMINITMITKLNMPKHP